VRRALEMLVGEGVVEKKAGLGTWVKAPPPRLGSVGGARTIVFALPESVSRIDRITEPCISALFFGIERELAQNDFQLTYTTLGEGEELPELLRGGQVAGVMFVSQMSQRVLLEARRAEVTAVVVNHYDPYFPSILPDRETGSRDAVTHLIDLGHRRIAFISGIPTYLSSRANYEGYRRALMEADLDWKDQPFAQGDWTFDGGYRAMTFILEAAGPPPTAVFAANDMSALGAIEAIRETGLQVPGDVSVVGFDDVEQCRQVSPRLTTVRVDTDLMARAACQKLLYTIESGQVHSVKIIVPAPLIVRESTAAARRDRDIQASFLRFEDQQKPSKEGGES
jgi:LacI family transcriptional regulator